MSKTNLWRPMKRLHLRLTRESLTQGQLEKSKTQISRGATAFLSSVLYNQKHVSRVMIKEHLCSNNKLLALRTMNRNERQDLNHLYFHAVYSCSASGF